MSRQNDDGGPAFTPRGPRCACGCHDGTVEGGLRDWFAGQAMQAMVGNFRVVNHRNPLIDGDVTTTEPHREMLLDYNIETCEYEGAAEIAADAYAIADAMLAARGPKGGA